MSEPYKYMATPLNSTSGSTSSYNNLVSNPTAPTNNTFVNGYTQHLNNNWAYQDPTYQGDVFNGHDGLYGISNHLSMLECLGTLNYLVTSLSTNNTVDESPSSLDSNGWYTGINTQFQQFQNTMNLIDQMNQVSFEVKSRKPRARATGHNNNHAYHHNHAQHADYDQHWYGKGGKGAFRNPLYKA